MKAVFIKEFGETLDYTDVADPAEPSENEVIVGVRAAGLNRADLLQFKGLYPPPNGFSPNIPGMEFAGEVEAIGASVAEFTPGDRVMGITAGEAQAEFVKVDAALLTSIPTNLSFTGAAAIPEVFITADDAIFSQCGLRPGETLLIHAVGSGVGLAALQIAKAAGARVFGTSRTADKIERCGAFDLDTGIVTDDAAFTDAVIQATEGRGADVILDLVGASYFKENLECLAQQGRIILVGLSGGSTAEFDMRRALYKRAKIFGTVLRARSIEEKSLAVQAFVTRWSNEFARGRIVPNVDRAFPVEEVGEAYEYLASNASFGKVILEF